MSSPNTASHRANAMSVDVEDYFQVAAFSRQIDRGSWESMPCRVERNIALILDMLDRHQAKATFFTLGWIADRYPGMVRQIVDRGHELASHGYAHERISCLSPEALREDLVRAKGVLENIGGVGVHGYRAPSFSIGAGNLWAHDVIAETGHRYSSSVYPIAHDHYGMPDAPRFPWRTRRGLIEIPPSSLRLLGRNLPAAGGGYFRLLPYPVSHWSIRRVNRLDGQPCVFYFHPWEVDPAQPRITGSSLRSRFRHYVNLERMASRLELLLSDFRWERIDRAFAEVLEEVAAADRTAVVTA